MQPSVLLFLAAVSPSLAQNNAQGVYDSITQIDIAVRNLTSKITSYSGGILQAAPFLEASLNVHGVNREGFNRASAAPRFSSDQSRRIVENVERSVGVSISEGLEVLKSKKPLLDQAELSSVARSFVTLLRNDHDSFSLKVGEKLSADQFAAGGIAAGTIDLVLRDAELYFQTP